MPDSTKEKETRPVRVCKVCQATSEERVVLCGEYRGETIWVCVRCLPMLIHGEH